VPGTGALPRAIERRARRGKNHKIGAPTGRQVVRASAELGAESTTATDVLGTITSPG
jgi:hypothetical protein